MARVVAFPPNGDLDSDEEIILALDLEAQSQSSIR